MIDPLPEYTETDSGALQVDVLPVSAPAPVDEPKQELPFRKPSRSERDGGLVPYPLPVSAPVDEPKQEVPFRKPSKSERDGSLVPYPLPPTPLPAGTRRPTPHTFTFDSSLSVRFTSQAMRSDWIPIFHNKGTVSGTVDLVVKGGPLSNLQSVTISLRGYRRNDVTGVYSWGRACRFMRRTQVLWDSTLPRLPKGRVEIPFELRFPEICVLLDRSVEPPPSFRAPGYPYYFYYQLECTVKYKLLKVDAEFAIPVKFVPRKVAGAPSSARAFAYETKTQIPHPLADPTGWISQSCEVDARAFGVRDVHISCVLSLPVPLEYARGCLIPYHLAVACADDQVLDVLSTHSAIRVVLNREAIIIDSFGQDDDTPLDIVGHGCSWVVKGETPPSTRLLDGEIKLSPQLMQSFSYYPQFSLRYSVHMCIDAPGISITTPNVKSGAAWLTRTPVEITYLPHDGSPLPVSYAPPLRPGETEQSLYIKPMPPLHFTELSNDSEK